MVKFLKHCSEFMKLKSHGHIFCPQQRSPEWILCLNEVRESVMQDEFSANLLIWDEILVSFKQDCLSTLKKTKSKVKFHQKGVISTSAWPNVVYVWRRDYSFLEIISTIEYFMWASFPFAFGAMTSATFSIPSVMSDDTLLTSTNGVPRTRSVLHRKQKPIKRILSALQNLRMEAHTALNIFDDMEVTASACLLENRPQTFAGCDMDSDCIMQMKTLPVKFFATEVLNSESQTKKEDSDCRAAKEYALQWIFFYRWEAKRRVEVKLWIVVSSKVSSSCHSNVFNI